MDRNTIYLRTIHAEETTESVNAVVATYQTKEREFSDGNATHTETVATDVRVNTHELSYGPGWPMLEIPLRQADETREVAIWLVDDDGEPIADDLRWHFEHESVATTADAGVDSEGDYLTRALLEFVLPTIGGAFAIGIVCKRAIDRAGRGPMWGYGRWITLLSIAIGMLTLTQFSTHSMSVP